MTTHSSTSPLNTAVLFLVFNRPDVTAQVFAAIRQAKPPRLYLAADGPREGRPDEAERVAKVREIATSVDWLCDVKTLFREKNLGCKYAVSSAITWFFEQEEKGIILEDDCLPHSDFFRYCEFCLAEFKENSQIWHINGNNFAADRTFYGENDIAFVGLAQPWGWATWADRWRKSQKNVFYLAKNSEQNIGKWNLSPIARFLKRSHIDSLISGLDTWDYQWQISILNASGFAVSPASNLISNLGDGVDATHTRFDTKRTHLPLAPLLHFDYPEVGINANLNGWYEKKMGLRGWNVLLKILGRRIWSLSGITLKCILRRLMQKAIFRGVQPIVIASTGRSGSTLLTDAVAESYISARFNFLPSFARIYVRRLSMDYLHRISDIDEMNAPILKTHGLFQEAYSQKAKYIFIFGDPLESACSVALMSDKYGTIWIEEHIFNLAGEGSPLDIFQKDILNYEAQLKSWCEGQVVFVVHFDDLWTKNEELNKFLGFYLRLPERTARAEKPLPIRYNKMLFDDLKQLELEVRTKVK